MRISGLRRAAATPIAILLLATAGTSAALAKEGLSVNLAAPLPGDATPGTTIPAFFTMQVIGDDVASPLHGAAAFLRLYGPTGAMTEAAGVEQSPAGTYKAMIEVPAGGISRAEFGIHGAVKSPAGKVVATDPVWPYDGVLVTRIPPPVATAAPVAAKVPDVAPVAAPAAAEPVGSGASALQIDLRPILALGAIMAAGLALALGRRRLRTTGA